MIIAEWFVAAGRCERAHDAFSHNQRKSHILISRIYSELGNKINRTILRFYVNSSFISPLSFVFHFFFFYFFLFQLCYCRYFSSYFSWLTFDLTRSLIPFDSVQPHSICSCSFSFRENCVYIYYYYFVSQRRKFVGTETAPKKISVARKNEWK